MSLSPAMQSYREAARLFEQREFSAARERIGSALDVDPQLYDAYFLLARLCLEQHEYAQALSLLENLSRRMPGDLEVAEMLTRIYSRLGEPERAVGYLRGAVRWRPDHAASCLALADLYLSTGKPRKAVAHLKRLVRRDPENLDALLLLGDAYLQVRKLKRAEDVFSRCLVLDPDHRGAKRGLSSALNGGVKPPPSPEEEERHREVESLRETAARQANDGQIEEAIQTLTVAYRLAPETDDLLYQMALLYRRGGMPERCGEILQELVVQVPDNPLYHYQLGVWESQHGNPEKALHRLECCVELDPYYAEALHELGVCQQRLRRPAQAEVLLRRSLEVSGGAPETFLRLSQTQYQRGSIQESRATLETCVARFPEYREARLALANFLRLEKRYDEAEAHLDAVLAVAPEDPSALRARDLIVQERGHSTSALGATEKATERDGRKVLPRAQTASAFSP